jgi:hypothetical protein
MHGACTLVEVVARLAEPGLRSRQTTRSADHARLQKAPPRRLAWPLQIAVWGFYKGRQQYSAPSYDGVE